MNILRFLNPDCIRLGMQTTPLPIAEDETPAMVARRREKEKERVMAEVAQILAASPDIINPSKLLRDLTQRESNATTAIAPGVAIPHVRTLQARGFVMGLARADEPGLHYGALDGEPTRLFLLLAAPPYDDRTYLQAERALAELLLDEDVVAELLTAATPQEVFNLLRRWFR